MRVICRECGREKETGDRVTFRETCDSCRSYLHSCRQCRFREERTGRCTEPQAEKPSDPRKGNLCEWFQPAFPPEDGSPARPPGSGGGAREAAESAWRKLTRDGRK